MSFNKERANMLTLLRTIYTSVLTMIFCFNFSSEVFGHEPLFGLGPHTVGKYSWALESEFERGEHGWFNSYELVYGITPDIAVTAALPYAFSQAGRKPGFGDFVLRGKYRFLRQDFLNGSRAFALHLGLKFPTGSRSELRGSGAYDAFGGLSFGLESRRHYAFADIRYQIKGAAANINRANIFNFDAAYGIRPWQMEYRQPDLVILGEFLGEVAGKNSSNNIVDPNSGGFLVSFSPGILFSLRNVMLKAGVKIALLNKLNGIQKKPDPEFVLGLEFHMPPFK